MSHTGLSHFDLSPLSTGLSVEWHNRHKGAHIGHCQFCQNGIDRPDWSVTHSQTQSTIWYTAGQTFSVATSFKLHLMMLTLNKNTNDDSHSFSLSHSLGVFPLCLYVCQSGPWFERRIVSVCERMMSGGRWGGGERLTHCVRHRGMTLLHLAAAQGYTHLIHTLIRWR